MGTFGICLESLESHQNLWNLWNPYKISRISSESLEPLESFQDLSKIAESLESRVKKIKLFTPRGTFRSLCLHPFPKMVFYLICVKWLKVAMICRGVYKGRLGRLRVIADWYAISASRTISNQPVEIPKTKTEMTRIYLYPKNLSVLTLFFLVVFLPFFVKGKLFWEQKCRFCTICEHMSEQGVTLRDGTRDRSNFMRYPRQSTIGLASEWNNGIKEVKTFFRRGRIRTFMSKINILV